MTWRIVSQAHEQHDEEHFTADVVLANNEPDQARVHARITLEDDGLFAETSVGYPCRECGWDETCKDGCHS